MFRGGDRDCNIELGLNPMDILVECLSLRCQELVGSCRIKLELLVDGHVT